MTVNLSRRKAFYITASTIGLFNLLSFLHSLTIISGGLGLTILLLLPGVLAWIALTRKTRIIRINLETFLTSIGLSLAFLMVGGLAINTLGPHLGIIRPLSRLPLLLTYNILLLALFALALHNRKNIPFKINFERRFGIFDLFIVGIGLLSLILVLGGSQVLNNGGSGGMVLGAIIAIALGIILTVLARKKINPVTLPIVIFLFSFSLLLSYSLRSNYVFGWDVNGEYYVFQVANAAKHWTVANNHSPYNACLGITILPTVLSSIAHVSGEAFFKVVAQAVFALVPLSIFILSKSVLPFKKKDIAIGSFLAAIIFASQTWFIEQAPILIRQEVALFFFSLLLIAMISKAPSHRTLSILFGLMVVFSHYSTAYVMLSLFALYLLAKLLIFRNHPKLFSLNLFFIVLVSTFLWQYQMTNTAGNLNQALKQTISTLPQTFSSDGIGSTASQLTFSNPNLNTQTNADNNYLSKSHEYKQKYSDLYTPETYDDYSPNVVTNLAKPNMPPIRGDLGSALLAVSRLNKLMLSEIMPAIGLIVIGFSTLRTKEQKSTLRNYSLLASASMILLAIMLILPLLKTDYNLTRLWLQALIVFSPLIIVGGEMLLSKLPRLKFQVLAVLSAVFLLYTAGVTQYATTGNAPAMFSNNSGDYTLYYTTDGEALSTIWLNDLHTQLPIFADQLASLKLTSQGGVINPQNYVYPSTITKDSYVYTDQSNISGVELNKYKNGLLQFRFPNNFLQEQKNAVYANNNSVIYH